MQEQDTLIMEELKKSCTAMYTIKPLEWHAWLEDGVERYIARAIRLAYVITRYGSGKYELREYHSFLDDALLTKFDTAEEAKRAAEALWLERLMPFLEEIIHE